MKENIIDSIHQDMYKYFGDDTKRKNHAASVLKYANKISKQIDCDTRIVEIAAILHDIGIHEAEKKHGSSAGIYQEIEGPAIAKDILKKYNLSTEEVNHITKIISNHHSDKDISTIEFKIIWDSDWIVNIPDEFDVNNQDKIKRVINKVFKTKIGADIAKKLYLNNKISKARVWLDIDLSAIRRNYEKIKTSIESCRLMPVLKADAYGLGVMKIAETLTDAGAKYIGVAELNEALELKYLDVKIQILGGVIPDEIPIAIENNIILPITDLRIAQEIDKIAEKQNKIAECHLLIDTGMGRLGILEDGAYNEVQEIVKLKNITCSGIYSHFSSANDIKNSKTNNQINSFKNLLQKLEDDGIKFQNIHIANSDALNNFPESSRTPFNIARTGINLYGLFDEKGNHKFNLESVITLKSKIINIRKLKKGSTIGYGETHILEKDTIIATVSAGYADGIPYAISNKNFVIINDTKCPIIGRVSMDYITVDISNLDKIKIGDEVICLGCGNRNKITVEDWAKIKKTHSYDIICSFGSRVYRNYLL